MTAASVGMGMVGRRAVEVEVQDFGRDEPPAKAALVTVPGSLARFWERDTRMTSFVLALL